LPDNKTLNLGCGKDIREGYTNVDITNYSGVDMVIDLGQTPWPWPDNSIDGIRAAHLIEHFPEQKWFINECLRVLKKGGYLELYLPHSSSISSVGCLGHYRTFSYNTMNAYLGEDFYMFGKAKFKTIKQELRWWYDSFDTQEELSGWMIPFIKSANYILTRLAKLSPRICENLWCYWIGGFREVVWVGEKL